MVFPPFLTHYNKKVLIFSTIVAFGNVYYISAQSSVFITPLPVFLQFDMINDRNALIKYFLEMVMVTQ